MNRIRTRCYLVAGAVLAAGLAMVVAVAVAGEASSGTTDFGPYGKSFADLTTCGQVWTQPGPINISFHVYPRSADGSYFVDVEHRARYVTLAGQSLGACNNGQPDNGSTVGAGIPVTFSQSATVIVRNGTLNPEVRCQGYCSVAQFVPLAFGPNATFQWITLTVRETSRCNGAFIETDTFLPTPSVYDGGDISGPKRNCLD